MKRNKKSSMAFMVSLFLGTCGNVFSATASKFALPFAAMALSNMVAASQLRSQEQTPVHRLSLPQLSEEQRRLLPTLRTARSIRAHTDFLRQFAHLPNETLQQHYSRNDQAAIRAALAHFSKHQKNQREIDSYNRRRDLAAMLREQRIQQLKANLEESNKHIEQLLARRKALSESRRRNNEKRIQEINKRIEEARFRAEMLKLQLQDEQRQKRNSEPRTHSRSDSDTQKYAPRAASMPLPDSTPLRKENSPHSSLSSPDVLTPETDNDDYCSPPPSRHSVPALHFGSSLLERLNNNSDDDESPVITGRYPVLEEARRLFHEGKITHAAYLDCLRVSDSPRSNEESDVVQAAPQPQQSFSVIEADETFFGSLFDEALEPAAQQPVLEPRSSVVASVVQPLVALGNAQDGIQPNLASIVRQPIAVPSVFQAEPPAPAPQPQRNASSGLLTLRLLGDFKPFGGGALVPFNDQRHKAFQAVASKGSHLPFEALVHYQVTVSGSSFGVYLPQNLVNYLPKGRSTFTVSAGTFDMLRQMLNSQRSTQQALPALLGSDPSSLSRPATALQPQRSSSMPTNRSRPSTSTSYNRTALIVHPILGGDRSDERQDLALRLARMRSVNDLVSQHQPTEVPGQVEPSALHQQQPESSIVPVADEPLHQQQGESSVAPQGYGAPASAHSQQPLPPTLDNAQDGIQPNLASIVRQPIVVQSAPEAVVLQGEPSSIVEADETFFGSLFDEALEPAAQQPVVEPRSSVVASVVQPLVALGNSQGGIPQPLLAQASTVLTCDAPPIKPSTGFNNTNNERGILRLTLSQKNTLKRAIIKATRGNRSLVKKRREALRVYQLETFTLSQEALLHEMLSRAINLTKNELRNHRSRKGKRKASNEIKAYQGVDRQIALMN